MHTDRQTDRQGSAAHPVEELLDFLEVGGAVGPLLVNANGAGQ